SWTTLMSSCSMGSRCSSGSVDVAFGVRDASSRGDMGVLHRSRHMAAEARTCTAVCGASKAGRVGYVFLLALPAPTSRSQVRSVRVCPFLRDCYGAGPPPEGVVFEGVSKADTRSGERDGMDRGTVG